MQKESVLHLMLKLGRMVSTFNASDWVGDPAVALLMMTPKALAQANIPHDSMRALSEARAADPVTGFTISYPSPLTAEGDRRALCACLDYIYCGTRVDGPPIGVTVVKYGGGLKLLTTHVNDDLCWF